MEGGGGGDTYNTRDPLHTALPSSNEKQLQTRLLSSSINYAARLYFRFSRDSNACGLTKSAGNFPTTEFNEPAPTDPLKRAQREQKQKRKNRLGLVSPEIQPNTNVAALLPENQFTPLRPFAISSSKQ